MNIQRIKKEYVCPWCQFHFQQSVAYVTGGMDMSKSPPVPGDKRSLSDQVKCPKCRSFMPTWSKIDLGDGKSIKVRR
jgi:DNA-directed RNA polymerase subunit RPC12/RpoP